MHDGPQQHDHDQRFDDEKEHPLWKLDTVTLTSVGIDVGTATSQIIFSRLVLRRLGRELSSRFVVTERKTLYFSPVHFTPYAGGRERIDDQALGRLVDSAYQEAGLTPEQVDTGAIILTGEAIRRDNARAIADLCGATRQLCLCQRGAQFRACFPPTAPARSPYRLNDDVEFLTSISAAAPQVGGGRREKF